MSTYINGVEQGGGTPGGADTNVQFNDAGAFGGNSSLLYDKATGKLSAAQLATGDLLFDNGWYLTEGDKIGKKKQSIYLVRNNGTIAAVWDNMSVKDAIIADAGFVAPIRVTKDDAQFVTDQGVVCPVCSEQVANIRLYDDKTIDVQRKGKTIANGPKKMKINLVCSKGHPVEVSSNG